MKKSPSPQQGDYSFLQQPLLNFVENEQSGFVERKKNQYDIGQAIFDKDAGNVPFLDWRSEYLGQQIGSNGEEFYKAFVEPFLKLNPKEFHDILEHIGGYYANHNALPNTPQNPWPVTVNYVPTNSTSALQWLLVNVDELNLPGLNTKDGVFSANYVKPHHQCAFCGRLNHDEMGKAFTDKKRFCHMPGCTTDSRESPNPNSHVAGCCFGQWKKLKKELTQKLRYQMNKGYSKEQITDFFLSWCTSRYEANRQNLAAPRNSYEMEWHDKLEAYRQRLRNPKMFKAPLLELNHPLDFLRTHLEFPSWREMAMREREQRYPERKPYYPEAAQYEEILRLAKDSKPLP